MVEMMVLVIVNSVLNTLWHIFEFKLSCSPSKFLYFHSDNLSLVDLWVDKFCHLKNQLEVIFESILILSFDDDTILGENALEFKRFWIPKGKMQQSDHMKNLKISIENIFVKDKIFEYIILTDMLFLVLWLSLYKRHHHSSIGIY